MARDTGQWRWSISSAAPDGPSPSLLHCIIVSISWHGACSLMGQGGEEEEEEGGVGWGVHGGYIGEEWGLGVGGSVKRSCEWHAMHSTPPINFSVSTATATRVGALPLPPPPLSPSRHPVAPAIAVSAAAADGELLTGQLRSLRGRCPMAQARNSRGGTTVSQGVRERTRAVNNTLLLHCAAGYTHTHTHTHTQSDITVLVEREGNHLVNWLILFLDS